MRLCVAAMKFVRTAKQTYRPQETDGFVESEITTNMFLSIVTRIEYYQRKSCKGL